MKGIGFLCRVGFGADRDWAAQRFDPVELHPFVKVRLEFILVEFEFLNPTTPKNLLHSPFDASIFLNYDHCFLNPLCLNFTVIYLFSFRKRM